MCDEYHNEGPEDWAPYEAIEEIPEDEEEIPCEVCGEEPATHRYIFEVSETRVCLPCLERET